jgi:FtsZ-binding cell division protein ZapB
MKQTAVEWLIEQLTPSISLQQKHIDELKEQAKAMEKEQIENAYGDGLNAHRTNFCNREEYYNETYKKTI